MPFNVAFSDVSKADIDSFRPALVTGGYKPIKVLKQPPV